MLPKQPKKVQPLCQSQCIYTDAILPSFRLGTCCELRVLNVALPAQVLASYINVELGWKCLSLPKHASLFLPFIRHLRITFLIQASDLIRIAETFFQDNFDILATWLSTKSKSDNRKMAKNIMDWKSQLDNIRGDPSILPQYLHFLGLKFCGKKILQYLRLPLWIYVLKLFTMGINCHTTVIK